MPPIRNIGVIDAKLLNNDPQPRFLDIYYALYTSVIGPPMISSMTVRHFNEYFVFFHVVSDLNDAVLQISDPEFAVISMAASELAHLHRYLVGKELEKILPFHLMARRGMSVSEMRRRLANHACTAMCPPSYLIFRIASRPRNNIETRFIGHTLSIPLPASARPALPIPVVEAPVTASEPEQPPYKHLEIPNTDLLASIIEQWEREMSPANLQRMTCSVCAKLTPQQSVTEVDSSRIDLTLLRNDRLPPEVRPISYDFELYRRAILHPNGMTERNVLVPLQICSSCLSDLSAGRMPKFALCNWLYYGRDCLPRAVKQAFDESTHFERALICRARANVICCRFNRPETRGEDQGRGSYYKNAKGMKGNVLVSPLDVVKMNEFLPPPPEIPFLVRKTRVKRMIEFLLDHNRHYGQVGGFKGMSSTSLNALFDGNEDQGLPARVKVAYMEDEEAVDSATSGYVPESGVRIGEHDDPLLMENVGYTLTDRTPQAYRDMMLAALERCLSSKSYLEIQQGDRLIPEFGNPFLLAWLFPHLDPWGIGGFHEPQRTRFISMEDQLSHLLQTDDHWFENDPEFPLVFYNVLRKKLVSDSLRFTAPANSYAPIVRGMLSIDPEHLVRLSDRYKHEPLYKPSTPAEVEIIRLVKSVGLVARNVPGSPGQKVAMRNEIRGMINRYGAPSLFITLNPSDKDNHLVEVFARTEYSLEDLEDGISLESWQRQLLAARRPAACALFFHTVVEAFIRIILRHKKGRGLYGKSKAYYTTVEAQGRGTLHLHMLVWLEGHPSPDELWQLIQASGEYKDRLIPWLEFVMQGDFQGRDSRWQVEKAFSKRLERELTGGGGPHPGSTKGPSICRSQGNTFWKDYEGYLNSLLVEYNIHEHTSTCWKYLKRGEPRTDANCRVGIDGKTQDMTTIDNATGEIKVKKTHPRMTHYTALVMFLLKCNIDVRFIGSGRAANAYMYYITDYVTKPALTMNAGLAALSYGLKKAEERSPWIRTDLGEKDVTSAIITFVNSMFGKQEISQPQIMSYLIGGGDHYTSEEFQTFNWGNVVRYAKEATRQSGGTAECESNVAVVPSEGGGITVSCQRLDYMLRPTQSPFDEMCLYEFISWTKKGLLPQGTKDNELTENPRSGYKHFSSTLHPQFSTHGLKMRNNPAIPVLLGPNLARRHGDDIVKEQWATDMLLLFKPWHQVEDLLPAGSTSWFSAFDPFLQQLDPERLTIINNMNVLAQGREDRAAHPHPRRNREVAAQMVYEDDIEYDSMGAPNVSEICQTPYAAIGRDAHSGEPQTDNHLTRLLSQGVVDDLNRCYSGKECADVPSAIGLVAASLTTHEDIKTIEGHISLFGKYRPTPKDLESGGSSSLHQGTQLTRQRPPDVGSSSLPAVENLTQMGSAVTSEQGNEQIDIVCELESKAGLDSNLEQLRAFRIVAKHVLEGRDQLLMLVHGMGGTGKTYLIQTIVKLFAALGRRSELLLGAPTGIAAVMIGGNTLHSLIHMGAARKKAKKDSPIESPPSNRLQDTWRRVRYLIVDEISMVGTAFLALMSTRMKLAKGEDPLDHARPFGGVNIIFMGDFCQLKPVRETCLYSHKVFSTLSFAETGSNRGLDDLSGAYLWTLVKIVVQLKQNQRQATDPKFGQVLENLRVKEWSRPVLSERWERSAYLEYFRGRQISHVAAVDPMSLKEFSDAPIIVGQRNLRDAMNAKMVQFQAAKAGVAVHTYHSLDLISRRPTIRRVPQAMRQTLWNLESGKVKELLGFLPMFVGMKVMVTENIMLAHGIVNGAEGIIKGIKYHCSTNGERIADVVYVHIQGCGISLPGLDPDVVPLEPAGQSIEFPFDVLQPGCTARSFWRKQIPIIPAYAYTDYKSQGRSLERCIVDLASSRGQGIYVMLSRVKTLDGLLILRWFSPGQIFQHMSEELRNCLHRLEKLDDMTKSRCIG